jgi:hypothetical protein
MEPIGLPSPESRNSITLSAKQHLIIRQNPPLFPLPVFYGIPLVLIKTFCYFLLFLYTFITVKTRNALTAHEFKKDGFIFQTVQCDDHATHPLFFQGYP